ncbi:MAG: ligase-associated DNA damage response DEXH box helicase [Burkholderiales bacterium]|nr:ligase-associated DNA damage response DEXH box helicase [Burkholderiales bacterium]
MSATVEVTEASTLAWFETLGWKAFDFQREVWRTMRAGGSGLLHATTGSGKTYAVALGALQALGPVSRTRETRILWITPMRALAADSARALEVAVQALAPSLKVGLLTGDTSTSVRAGLQKSPATVLVTTPESLTLMLARGQADETLAKVSVLVVDEWHELIGNKRGVQLQLALARLRRLNPQLLSWALSATLGNLDYAQTVLLHGGSGAAHRVEGLTPKRLQIDTLIPDNIERFPWGGHLGMRQVKAVAAEIEQAATSLVFTNTRSQAEIWYQALLEEKPEWAGLIALHHGSLDKELRTWVENSLKTGALKAVVCTSSLDLGVDFLPVERVLQIGSPKGVARLLQRAGRSGHAPGRASRITVVPTHALELMEAAAARHAVGLKRIESRVSPHEPMDVLVQHLVTVAVGPGFIADELYAEVCAAYAFRNLSRERFDWALAFVEGGGASLKAYPDFHRIAKDEHQVYRVPRADIARRHRMSVGTIVSDASMSVAWLTGGRIGSIEESFIARLKAGDCFTFAGRVLELIRVRDMTAFVRKAPKGKGSVPQWQGGKMPLSSELAQSALEMLAITETQPHSAWPPEMQALQGLLEIQSRWSALPSPERLVIEEIHTKEGQHLFVYAFAGRMVNLGLASLMAYRMAKQSPGTFSISVNDYGFELLSADVFDWRSALDAQAGVLSALQMSEDVLGSLNSSELAQRRFREIARIAGLVFQGFPGASKSTKQLQASSGLFFEVFKQYDTDNLLLSQANTEAMEQELEMHRLAQCLQALQSRQRVYLTPPKPTPFAFPLMIERLRERISTEKLSDRVQRMVADLEKAARVS